MPRGRVKWYNPAKGYGFISQDDGGPDLFVHFTAIQGGLRRLNEGQIVEFEVREISKGKLRAEKVRVLDSGEGEVFPEREKTGKAKRERRPTEMKAKCPTCGAMIDLGNDVEKGDQVKCPHCGEVLKVVRLKPPRLDYDLDDDDYD